MDDTLKVLIGVLSGFITAFLAEPVKSYFQLQIKLNLIREMLYKEVIVNYQLLEFLEQSNESASDKLSIFKKLIKTEGYQYIKSTDISSFYQLQEAVHINNLYDSIYLLAQAKRPSKKVLELSIQVPIVMFASMVKAGQLDKKTLTKIINEKKLKGIISRA